MEDIDCTLSMGEEIGISSMRILEKIHLQKGKPTNLFQEISKYAKTTQWMSHDLGRVFKRKFKSLPGYNDYICSGGSLQTVPYGLRCSSPFLFNYVLSKCNSWKKILIHDFHSYELKVLVGTGKKIVLTRKGWWTDLWFDFFTSSHEKVDVVFDSIVLNRRIPIKGIPQDIAHIIYGLLDRYKSNSLVMVSLVESLIRLTGGGLCDWVGGDFKKTINQSMEELYPLMGWLKGRLIRESHKSNHIEYTQYTIYPSIGDLIELILFGKTWNPINLSQLIKARYPLIYLRKIPDNLPDMINGIENYDIQPLMYRGKTHLLLRRKHASDEKKRKKRARKIQTS